jgi:hypothetical protein
VVDSPPKKGDSCRRRRLQRGNRVSSLRAIQQANMALPYEIPLDINWAISTARRRCFSRKCELVMLRCGFCSKSPKETYCALSKFQFLKIDGNMIHLYTECVTGISNSKRNNKRTSLIHNSINNLKVRSPLFSQG